MCGWLTNFSPALVPVADEENDTDVQDYFNNSEFKRMKVAIQKHIIVIKLYYTMSSFYYILYMIINECF